MQYFPNLEPKLISATRDALHAYARVMGAWTAACRARRKHWWHASLRPSLNGLTTGVIHAADDFEIELNIKDSLLQVLTSTGDRMTETLRGQSADELSQKVDAFLGSAGIDPEITAERKYDPSVEFTAYAPEQAGNIGLAFNSVSAAMQRFRAGIPEETSPIQLWPHHFDMSMLWLPGDKIPGQDSTDEESSDKQMNFGFTLGDEGIREPYFYVTAYPLPDAFPDLSLPNGTTWWSDGFSGAVLPYQRLIQDKDPQAYLLGLWEALLSAGREAR